MDKNSEERPSKGMVGVEIDMIVRDSLEALALYEKIFEIQRVEVSDFPKGENEVIFTLYGVRFHMLDENPKFGLKAPDPDKPQTIWFNILVPDIKKTFFKAIHSGCSEIQPVTEIPDFGVSNAIFNDGFGYQWMLHQVHKVVSFEERTRLWEEKRGG
jgi:PhnB protein